MVFLSFFNTNLAFFALGAYKLKFSGYAYDTKLGILCNDLNSTIFHKVAINSDLRQDHGIQPVSLTA